MSDSLWPHEPQQTRPPCLSPTPRVPQTHVHWVDDAIQPSHLLLPPSPPALFFPASGSFQMSQPFTSGGQNIGDSGSASALPVNIQGWFLFQLTGLISLISRDSQESFPEPYLQSINSSALSLLYGPTLTYVHDCWENHSFDCTDLCDISKVMSLLFNTLSRFVKAFLPKNISNNFFLPKTFLPRNQMPFNLMAAVTICSDFGNLENKICHCFQISPCVCHEVLGLDALILVFWMSSFKPSFSLSSCTFTKRLFSSSSLSNIRVVSSTYLRLLILILAIMWMNQFYDLQIIFIVFTYRWLVNLTFKSCFLCVIFFFFALCIFTYQFSILSKHLELVFITSIVDR